VSLRRERGALPSASFARVDRTRRVTRVQPTVILNGVPPAQSGGRNWYQLKDLVELPATLSSLFLRLPRVHGGRTPHQTGAIDCRWWLHGVLRLRAAHHTAHGASLRMTPRNWPSWLGKILRNLRMHFKPLELVANRRRDNTRAPADSRATRRNCHQE
jgi:hypothetical protein